MAGSGRSGERASEGARRATGDVRAAGEQGRFSARRKRETVLRLLRGESLEAVSRELGVTAARLKAAGDGPTAPVASNDSEAGRAKNRRVELVKQ